MRKMKLNLDDLTVESFQTTPETDEGQKGTVFGYHSCPWPCLGDTYTCNESCNGTCVWNPTCEGSCGCPTGEP